MQNCTAYHRYGWFELHCVIKITRKVSFSDANQTHHVGIDYWQPLSFGQLGTVGSWQYKHKHTSNKQFQGQKPINLEMYSAPCIYSWVGTKMKETMVVELELCLGGLSTHFSKAIQSWLLLAEQIDREARLARMYISEQARRDSKSPVSIAWVTSGGAHRACVTRSLDARCYH